MKINL